MPPPTSRGSLSLATLSLVDSSSFWHNDNADSNKWYQSAGLRVRIPGGLLHFVSAKPLVSVEGEIVDLVSTSFRIHNMCFLLLSMDPSLWSLSRSLIARAFGVTTVIPTSWSSPQLLISFLTLSSSTTTSMNSPSPFLK